MLVECPHCTEKIDVSAIAPGAKASCPKCQGEFMTPDIPAATPVVQTDAPAGPPKTNGLAIASLVLAIIGFLTAVIGIGIIFAIIGLILGIVAMSQIKARPKEQGGYGLALAGTIVSGICFFIFALGILAAIAIPNFVSLRSKAYDASAKSAGRNAKLAEEVWYNDYEGDIPRPYSNDLSVLLSVDKDLTADPDVTFTFGTCNASGFTLTTQHAKGGQTFEYTD